MLDGLWVVASAQTRGPGPQWPRMVVAARQSLCKPASDRSGAGDTGPPNLALSLASRSSMRCAKSLPTIRRLAIKWPNDILYDGAKLAGILLESANLPDGRFACVAGIGVNCGSHPQDTPYKATDLGR